MPDSDTSLSSETFSVTLKWTLKDVNEIFSSTSGDNKSKAIKSPLFGNGSWQLLFYANAGGDNKDYTSIYLNAEPTKQEQDPHNTGQIVPHWIREGLYKFTIDMKSGTGVRTFIIRSLEAVDHSFSDRTSNWGWTKFTPRSSIMNNVTVRDTNMLTIAATVIHTLPIKTTNSSPTNTFISVPIQLIDSIGKLLNIKDISDVRFIIEPEKKGGERKVIYAQKSILMCRSEYFQTMFSSTFAEGHPGMDEEPVESNDQHQYMTTVKVYDSSYSTYYAMLYFLYTDKITFGKVNSSSSTRKKRDRRYSKPEEDDINMEQEDSVERYDENIEVVDEADVVDEEEDDDNLSPLGARSSSPITSANVDQEKEELSLTGTDIAEVTEAIDSAEAVDTAETAEEYEYQKVELIYFGNHEPLQTSSKALYRLADKYNITELAKRCFVYLTQYKLCTRHAFSELVGTFAHDFPAYRQVVLEFVLKHWKEVLEHKEEFNQVMRGGQSKYIGFADAWAEIAPRLQFTNVEVMET